MNEKQAKRIRRAARAFIEIERKSLESRVATASQQADVFVEQLHMMWPSLNHKQRGAVSACTKGYAVVQWRARLDLWPIGYRVPTNLRLAVKRAIQTVLA